MSTCDVNQCPEWCESDHEGKKMVGHIKHDRCVMVAGVGLLFSNTYLQYDNAFAVWRINGVLGTIDFIFDGSEPNYAVKARYEETFEMYQKVADARLKTIVHNHKAANDS